MQRPANRAALRDRAALQVCRQWMLARAVAVSVLLLGLGMQYTAEGVTANEAQPVARATSPQAVDADDVVSNAQAADRQALSKARYTTKTLRGRVVWMADALEENYGVATVAEARERVIALATTDGGLYPIMEDSRGRSFRRDKRLREMDVELVVRQYEGLAVVQVIRTYALDGQDKYRLDYWCEICSIAMVELKPCDCCRAATELRRRKVEASKTLAPQATAEIWAFFLARRRQRVVVRTSGPSWA